MCLIINSKVSKIQTASTDIYVYKTYRNTEKKDMVRSVYQSNNNYFLNEVLPHQEIILRDVIKDENFSFSDFNAFTIFSSIYNIPIDKIFFYSKNRIIKTLKEVSKREKASFKYITIGYHCYKTKDEAIYQVNTFSINEVSAYKVRIPKGAKFIVSEYGEIVASEIEIIEIVNN